MTETHSSKVSRMKHGRSQEGDEGDEETAKTSETKAELKDNEGERILSGDTNMLCGTDERMTKELTALAPSTMKIKVIRRGLERSLTRRGQTSSRGNDRLEGCSCLVR